MYSFWGDDIARELEKEESLVVNLASEEYSKAVVPHLRKDVDVISPVFLEEVKGSFVTKGVYAKMARGEMVRFLAENKILDKEGIKEFSVRGYRYNDALSTSMRMAFVRKE